MPCLAIEVGRGTKQQKQYESCRPSSRGRHPRLVSGVHAPKGREISRWLCTAGTKDGEGEEDTHSQGEGKKWFLVKFPDSV